MRALRWLVTIGLLCAAVFVAAAQKDDKARDDKSKDDKAKKEAKKDAAADPLAALYPQPTDAHKELVKADQGVWDATMKGYFAGPDQPPQVFKGVETVRAAADGLFLITEFEADFVGGKKFKGHGISGYDVQKMKLIGAWADNMSTSIGTLEGDYDPKKKTVTLWFQAPDPGTGRMRKDKHVVEYKADGHKLYTIYHSPGYGAGEPVKVLEIESKRRKDSGDSNGEAKKETKKDGKENEK